MANQKFIYGQYIVLKNNYFYGVYKIVPYYSADMTFPIEYKVYLINKSNTNGGTDYDVYTTDLNSFITEDNLFDSFFEAEDYFKSLPLGSL